jgi:hypothetical protein
MKIRNILFVFIIVFNTNSFCQFKVVFVADPNGFSSSWYNEVVTNWEARGICLRAIWGDMDNDSTPGVDSWTNFDAAINTILQTPNIDIYIRINMGFKKPTWVSTTSGYFFDNDFQIIHDSTKLNASSDPLRMYPLNFNSPTSKMYMEQFFAAILDHINTHFPAYKYRFKEVVPSFNTDEETEYPFQDMCGYSTYEITAFQTYLQTIYGSISALNQKWNSGFSTWANIDPKNFNWNSNDNLSYLYPKGRTDWMNFRTNKLADIISEFSSIAHIKGFQVGIQFGSIYDSLIERRGWVDPTRLIENVNSVHTAERPEYHNTFNFGADYARSLCKFWTQRKNLQNNPKRFSTEINLLYNTDGNLYWDDQLVNYFDRGASEIYLYGWWSYTASQLENFKTTYSGLYNAIVNHSGHTLASVDNSYAIHLGCEQVLFNHNQNYELYNSIIAQDLYSSIGYNYKGDKDIITNDMVKLLPSFLNNYKDGICFSKGSLYMSDTTYVNIMKSSITPLYINATNFLDNGHREYKYTPGLYNEYGETRSPIHLIWRSRPDLQLTWPTANLPASGSGHSEDFISWALNYGCGYYNSNLREYSGWVIKNSTDDTNYYYDKNIRTVWDQRSNLQTAFPGGHYNNPGITSVPNMISWATQYGYSESPVLLAGYNNWPYIGDNRVTTIISAENGKSNITSLQINNSLDNYPNPFNPATIINYQLSDNSFVTLKVYDILGKEIKTLVNGYKTIGKYAVNFDGSSLASGIYFYQLRSNSYTATKKMLLLK